MTRYLRRKEMDMRFPRPRRPSPALTISVIALVVAMAGTGYAAFKLPRNSVGSKQIKANAVTSAKVKNGTLLAGDFKRGQVPVAATGRDGATGPTGPAGPTGSNGTNGINGKNGTDGIDGAPGPSDGYRAVGSPGTGSGSASLTVPAGDYIVTGSAEGFNHAATFPVANGEMQCGLSAANDPTHGVGTFATVPNRGYSDTSPPTDAGGLANVTLNTGFHLPNGGTIVESCQDAAKSESATQLTYANILLTAVRVGTLHG